MAGAGRHFQPFSTIFPEELTSFHFLWSVVRWVCLVAFAKKNSMHFVHTMQWKRVFAQMGLSIFSSVHEFCRRKLPADFCPFKAGSIFMTFSIHFKTSDSYGIRKAFKVFANTRVKKTNSFSNADSISIKSHVYFRNLFTIDSNQINASVHYYYIDNATMKYTL